MNGWFFAKDLPAFQYSHENKILNIVDQIILQKDCLGHIDACICMYHISPLSVMIGVGLLIVKERYIPEKRGLGFFEMHD